MRMNMNMKTTIKIFAAISFLGFLSTGCEDLQSVTPTSNFPQSNLSAKFTFVNASPDAPSLDLYVNNTKVGISVTPTQAQPGYSTVPITTNNVGANTNIRAKATSNSIGGILGSSDIIYRSGNTSTNNFTAAAGASYTLIALDTLNRPKPLRTLNSQNFGDVTYYSYVNQFVSDTTIQLSGNNSIVIANLIKQHNSGNLPSTFIPIGVVPLGSSDVGGPRFLLITDNLPAPATSPVFPTVTAGKFAARFINASPDAGTATCQINSVTVGGLTTYPMLQSNFNPTVGSRSTTVAYTNNVTAAGTYDIVVTVGANTFKLLGQSFADGGIYTVVLAGSKVKGTLAVALAP